MILKSCIWRPVHFVAPLPTKRTTPKAIVLHTNAIHNGPASLFGNYDARARDPNSSEHLQVAHIQVALDGTAEQYANTDVILGLTWDANPFSVGIEAQDGGTVDSQPYTDAQIAKFIEIAKELGVPARVLPENGSGGGVGYHQEYGSWNQSGHNCPGKARRAQVQDVINGLKAPKGGFMGLSFKDEDEFGAAMRRQLTGTDKDKGGLGQGQISNALNFMRGAYDVYNDGTNDAEAAGKRFAEDLKKVAAS